MEALEQRERIRNDLASPYEATVREPEQDVLRPDVVVAELALREAQAREHAWPSG